jgi:CBS domain containing-hemolysin-like protein
MDAHIPEKNPRSMGHASVGYRCVAHTWDLWVPLWGLVKASIILLVFISFILIKILKVRLELIFKKTSCHRNPYITLLAGGRLKWTLFGQKE